MNLNVHPVHFSADSKLIKLVGEKTAKLQEINDKIIEQLNKWIIFTFSHPIEYELSKKLTEIIPCAEMVRFWKSWSDATTSAIRLARYVTNR